MTDARTIGLHGSNGIFSDWGYAVSSGSCPVGYVEQCVPDYDSPYYGGITVSSAISSAGGISSTGGVIPDGGIIPIDGVIPDGGVIPYRSRYRSFSAYKACPPCPPSHVCIPSTGHCIFIFPG